MLTISNSLKLENIKSDPNSFELLQVDSNGNVSTRVIQAQYELPPASPDTKGGIKVGTGLTMNNETLSVSDGRWKKGPDVNDIYMMVRAKWASAQIRQRKLTVNGSIMLKGPSTQPTSKRIKNNIYRDLTDTDESEYNAMIYTDYSVL